MAMQNLSDAKKIVTHLQTLANETQIDLSNAKIRRSSSRLCLGVEHGDYNGTELFGVGTDRFIWLAYKPNSSGRMRLFSGNFADDGVVEFDLQNIPEPQTQADRWARFAFGACYILKREGYGLTQGFDAVIYGNIPGGGMSRSASISINLLLTIMEVNQINIDNDFKIVEMAQALENDYIGSPCGLLDQIMIYYAKEGMGTHYNPKSHEIKYVPLGDGAMDFRFVVMDTGTNRPGLEKSTYKIRRQECDDFTAILQQAGYKIERFADVHDEATYQKIKNQFCDSHKDMFDRFNYIYHAQHRFYDMMKAWQQGDIETVGQVFREDGIGLRDVYKISGLELETMCEIARNVEGVLGERMLGGGDKGASGAIIKAEAIDDLRWAIDDEYPRHMPDFADNYAMHICKPVGGIEVIEGLL